MQRYFVDKKCILNTSITLTNSDVYHMNNVMRMHTNDCVIISDNTQAYLAEITYIDNEKCTLFIKSLIEENKELHKKVTIAHGLVRKEKMEELIDYLSELGCTSYQSVIMEKSIVKITKDDFLKKLPRLEKISKEASEQSQRVTMMNVLPLITFNDLINSLNNFDCVCVCDTSNNDLKTINEIYLNDSFKNILFIIGPEAGFSKKELTEIYNHKVIGITLGSRILRTQVAPIYVMSVIGSLDK